MRRPLQMAAERAVPMTHITRVADIMTKEPTAFAPDLEIVHAASQLLARRISGAPVVDSRGQIVGILTARDCFKAVLNASYYEGWGGVVSDYMSSPVETMDAGLDIITAAKEFLNNRFRRFPVVETGRLVGVISRFDVLRALYDQR